MFLQQMSLQQMFLLKQEERRKISQMCLQQMPLHQMSFYQESTRFVCRGAANDFDWRLVNGLWGVILALGLLWTTLTVRQARSWVYFKGWIRSFLADYGVPLLVVIWSALGYAVNRGTPSGIPRRTRIPNTWDEKTNWRVARGCC